MSENEASSSSSISSGERPSKDAVILLTGATGFLGKVVLEELIRKSDELRIATIRVFIRGASPEIARTRFRNEILRSPAFDQHPEGWSDAIYPIAGDLSQPGCDLRAEDRERITSTTTHIIHCAASVDFNLPLHDAAAANISAALETLALAEACPQLVTMTSVSTAYVTPHRGHSPQVVKEELSPLARDATELWQEFRDIQNLPKATARTQKILDETGHPNTYTLTKCVAEHLLISNRRRVPLNIVRPSIISASERYPEPGWIDSPAAFASFVMLLGTGRLQVVSGDPNTELDLVACDAVSHSVLENTFTIPPPASHRFSHAVAGRAQGCAIALCRDRILDYFGRHPVHGGPRLRFVGPRGLQLALHAFIHRMRASVECLWLRARGEPALAKARRKLAERQAELNRSFSYFTHNTFDFECGTPPPTRRSTVEYIDRVCEGVHRNLLQRRRAKRGR